jgi:hypothetical protein
VFCVLVDYVSGCGEGDEEVREVIEGMVLCFRVRKDETREYVVRPTLKYSFSELNPDTVAIIAFSSLPSSLGICSTLVSLRRLAHNYNDASP